MGGKHKQSNRTKNNTRPSSSSHSAELLGNTIPTFFGFSSMTNRMPTTSGYLMDDISHSINPDFQVLFKQMNKKDPITRYKALQLFLDLVNNSDTEEVKSILPLWPRIYCMLCIDVDHKVREISHKAQRVVVSKVKKMIAPYLKELAGPWFTSQYDTYAPAASAATLAFEEAFPSSKLNKAIAFCQEEILAYIYDNLIIQTPQTLCNPNNTSPEDMKAKYERVVLASLQGYALYLQKLSSDQIKDAKESNNKLLSHSKFWKYSRNKVPLIRSSFYCTLISLCQNAKFLLEGQSSHLSSVIFNNLDESDAVVLQSLWDAALNTLVTVEDCWSFIDIEKQLFAKLNTILKSGGRNVCAIYPNILPLLSKLPEHTVKNKEVFYGNLFESMRCGLEVTPVNPSPSDGRVMSTTFVECLKFIIKQNSSNVEFCSSLILDHLVPALDKLLIGKTKGVVRLPFMAETASLIAYWNIKRTTENPIYDKLMNDFFNSLSLLYSNQLNSEVTRESVKELLNNQVEFMSILINPDQFKPRSKGHVKFTESNDDDTEEVVTEKITTSECPSELLEFIKKQTTLYFLKVIQTEEISYVRSIAKIIKLVDAKIIFEDMITAVNECTIFKLFTSYFSKWLMKSEMKCKELIEVSFNLLKYVAFDEKEYILDELNSDWLCDSLRFDICRTLPHYANDECVFRWVRGEKFIHNVLGMVERFIDGYVDDVTPRDIIAALFKVKCNNGEYIIDAATSASIMNILSQRLEFCSENCNALELSQDLILDVEIGQSNLPSFSVLVTTLVKLSCHKVENEKLLKACSRGLKIISHTHGNPNFKFTDLLSDAIRGIIISDEIQYSLERVVTNVRTYVNVAVKETSNGSLSPEQEVCQAIQIIRKFLDTSEETDLCCQQAVKMLEKCCHLGYVGNGNLDVDYLIAENNLNFPKCPAFNLSVIRKYVKWNLFVGNILNLIFLERPKYLKRLNTRTSADGQEEKDDEADVKIENSSVNFGSEEGVQNIFQITQADSNVQNLQKDVCDFLLSTALLETFNKYHAGTKYYRELNDTARQLKKSTVDLVKNMSDFESKFIYDQCQSVFSGRSIWWIVNPVFNEIINGNSNALNYDQQREKSNLSENFLAEFEKMDILKCHFSMHRRIYFTILCIMENQCGHLLTEKQWENIFINIHKFLETFLEKPEYSEEDIPSLIAGLRLYLKLRHTFRNNHALPSELRIWPETCLAWNEVVQTEIYDKVILIWRKLASIFCHQKDLLPEWDIALQTVSDVVMDGLGTRKCATPNDSVCLAMECVRLLMSPHAVIQITSFRICVSTIPNLVKLDTEMFGNNMSRMFQDNKENSSPSKKSANDNWSIKNFEKVIADNQGIVETLLSDFIVGDYCTIEPFTDSFTYTYSYLLVWCFILKVCGEVHSSLRVQYGCWLQETGYTSSVLDSLFKLMPQAVVHGSAVDDACQKYFENYETLDFREPMSSELIAQMACLVYRLFLERLPNYVREWWKEAENKTSSLVDNVTKLYVSPLLISNELKNVQQDRETGFDNIEVKTYPGSREVVATYTIDEVKMDLVMTLPPNYPLGTAKIESSNVVVGTSKWRNLLFQICKYLIHQNGTIWDALVIWKNNLDKKFEGVEECYICFSILQGSAFEIPRLCCHTCKKKFHSSCLYKWFSTSNNSTCPICRNLF